MNIVLGCGAVLAVILAGLVQVGRIFSFFSNILLQSTYQAERKGGGAGRGGKGGGGQEVRREGAERKQKSSS